VSESFAKRLAKLEARINALRAKKDIAIVLKPFARPAPTQERVEASSDRLWPCPGECGGSVRSGWPRCDTCGAELAWPER
jgi:hypothetical protein